MAFKGDLTNISLFDVFQTLSQNQQTGVLVLSRDGITKKIHISPDGVRIFFTRSFRPLRLGEIFVRRGRITSQDVEILLLEQKKEYRPIGELLIESGKVTEEEVVGILRYHAEDEIFEIFGWEAGKFSFYDGQEAGDSTTPLSDVLMDPASLCLEAARRLDEMERLREVIPTNDEYYAQVEEAYPDPEQHGRYACAVFDALAESNSVDDLRDLVGLSLYDVLTALQRLVAEGYIRPRTVEELFDAGLQARDSGHPKRAALLFEKAHHVDPTNREILQECVEAIERLGEPRRVARYLAALGAICLAEGQLEEAIDYLEQTLRSDGTHFGAMISLRDAFIQQKDAERVAEMSLKIARTHSERGDLTAAITSCVQGLDLAPDAVPLRFYYAQLLARTDRVDEARDEIYGLVHETERERRTARTEKTHELLASCYRLLLKIDPEDEEARLGMRDIDRRRMSSLRRRKLLVRGGVAAALLLVVAGVGLTIQGPSAPDLMQQIENARLQNNHQRALDLIDELIDDYPESDEAQTAMRLRREIRDHDSVESTARRQREAKIRKELDQKLSDLRAALSDRPYLEALQPVREFLGILDRPDVAFLRRNMTAHLEYDLSEFLGRVKKRFDDDRQQVTVAEVILKQYRGKDASKLRGLEDRLARVRQRNWFHMIPELSARLEAIGASRYIGKAKREIDEFREHLQGAQGVFSNLDSLYHIVHRERMRVEITDLVRIARTQGKDYMMNCEFAKARRVYDDAYRAADAVTDEEPREHYRELIVWLETNKIIHKMRVEREKIDAVVATLDDVEKLVRENRADAAYRLLRDLVSEYRLIKFEREYTMPYRVTSTPDGAEVFVNGKPIARTPCTISLEISQSPVRIRLRREGFEDEDASLVPIDPKLDGTLRVELEKKLAWDKEITGGGIEASPVIARGMVLLATTDASLLAINLEDGSRAWEAPTGLLHRIKARPVVAGDSAYVITVNGSLHEVRLSDGKIVHQLDLRGQVHHDPVFVDDTLYLVTRKSLLALRGNKVVYAVPLEDSPSTRVVFKDGLICVGTAEGALLVHDAGTGAARDRLRVPSGSSFWGGLADHGDLVLAGAEDGKLYAFDLKKRVLSWTFPTTGPLAAPAVSAGRHIYLGARDGYIHLLTANGEKMGQLDMGYAVLAEPALAKDFLYVLGSHRVKAFSRDGASWWERVFPDETPQHVVAGEEYVVVVTDKPWVYTFPKDVR
ncbi:MAG: DUF4388 domain-containing protein [Planctomycetota bacterium]|jgi:outer membrane protein assembly factor BamB/tetratricopeptide (TPR) repeat protein